MPPLEEDRFLLSFSHIFAGGYRCVALRCLALRGVRHTKTPQASHNPAITTPPHKTQTTNHKRKQQRGLLLLQVGGGDVRGRL